MKFDASTRADAFSSLVSVKDIDETFRRKLSIQGIVIVFGSLVSVKDLGETYFAENYKFKV
jgi:hypothetical protein